MEFNQGILNKIEDGMSFARSVVIFLLGFGMIIFVSFSLSQHGSTYFSMRWYSVPFCIIGSFLIVLSVGYWAYSAYQLLKYGNEIFSIRSAIKETKQKWEALVALRIFDATGNTPPKVITDLISLKPELLPLMEELLKLITPDGVFNPDSGSDIIPNEHPEKPANNPPTK